MNTKVYFVKFLRHSGRVVTIINKNTRDVQSHFLRPKSPREWSYTSVILCLVMAGMLLFGLIHWILDNYLKRLDDLI